MKTEAPREITIDDRFPRESPRAGRVNGQIGPVIDYEYISMREKERFASPARKITTKLWTVENKRSGSVLGMIAWECGWRQYCFLPVDSLTGLVFSRGCLRDIADFIDRKMVEWKAGRGT